MSEAADRTASRLFAIDLALEDEIRPLAKRKYKARRQEIVSVESRDGTVERFTVRQTVPYCGYETPNPPSPKQHEAVMSYFSETCETPFQASTMLSARDYAEFVANDFRFNGMRKYLVSVGIAAFILSDRQTRALVRSLSISSWQGSTPAISRSKTHAACYKRVVTFASKLVADVRGQGAEIFG